MGEALDKAKKNLGLKENPDGQAEKEPKPDAMTDLEAAIATVGNIEAKELLQAKARELRAQLELRAREAESRARHIEKDTGAGRDGGDADEKIKAKKELISNSLVLLDKGLDPEVVARYIIGSQGMQYPISMGGGGQQGLTLADIKVIVDMVRGSGGPDPQITATLNQLSETVKGLKPVGSAAPPDPVAMIKAQSAAITEMVNSLVEAGLVVRPESGGGGKSIEEMKEGNRHLEKMEELKTDKDYKSSIAETLADIPVSIGKGIAKQAREVHGSPAKGQTKLETFPCNKCGAKILVTPETGDTITCGNCGQTYKRGEEKEEAAVGEKKPGADPAPSGG